MFSIPGSYFVFTKYFKKPDIVIRSTTKNIGHKIQKPSIQPPIGKKPVPSKSNSETEQFTKEEIRQAAKEVIQAKRQELSEHKRPSVTSSKSEYIIELVSGVQIHTDNLKIGEDQITYTWDDGTEISISNADVQSIKPVRLAISK